MATSGSKSVAVTSWDTLKFTWSLSSQSVTNNTSTVTWKLQLISTSSGRIDSSSSKSWSVTVNGTKYSGTNTVGIANNSTKTLASGTTTISHNSDGTKTFSYSFSQSFSGVIFSGTDLGTKSGSGTGTLTTIARKSTLSASNGTLGTAQTLTINRSSSSFTHTITYSCGSASGTITTKTTGASVSFTPPLSLASQNTTGTSVSVKFTITTYSGSTSLGSNTKTITCSIPSSVKPSCAITVTDPTGYKDTYGKAIKGLSKFKVVVTPTTSYGSAIASYKTTANGSTYTAASFTTGVLKSSGNMTVNATVTDKRGRTGNVLKSFEVYDYSVPTISKMTVTRCQEDGTSSSSGTHLAVKFDAVVNSLDSKNTATYVVMYKRTADTVYTPVTLNDYKDVYSISGGVCIFPAETSSSYDVILKVTDNFKSITKTGTGSSIKKLWSVLKRGLGIAFGKVAELEGYVEFAFKTKFYHGEVPQDALTIPANANLNEYTTPGYYVFSSVDSPTIVNIPIGLTASGSVEVIREGEDKQVRQVCTRCSVGYREIWERLYYSNSWHEWQCIYKGGSDSRVLWSGNYYMTAGHTATLSEAISKQPNGIVLVFSPWENSEAKNNNFQHFFVHKVFVAAHPSLGSTFVLHRYNFVTVAAKYLYISDTSIKGNDANSATGTSASGVTYNNAAWVLRYVIGV